MLILNILRLQAILINENSNSSKFELILSKYGMKIRNKLAVIQR